MGYPANGFVLELSANPAILRELCYAARGGVSLEQQGSDIATLPAATACNVLMIYPRFMADSFWNFSEACELVGARYPAIPLGLITVAALLPKSWNVRLVNRNTEELSESDLAWPIW